MSLVLAGLIVSGRSRPLGLIFSGGSRPPRRAVRRRVEYRYTIAGRNEGQEMESRGWGIPPSCWDCWDSSKQVIGAWVSHLVVLGGSRPLGRWAKLWPGD